MALEAAMADMMKDVQGVLATANETKAELNKVRRKSRELEDSLGDMAEASDAWNKLGQGRRARRGCAAARCRRASPAASSRAAARPTSAAAASRPHQSARRFAACAAPRAPTPAAVRPSSCSCATRRTAARAG